MLGERQERPEEVPVEDAGARYGGRCVGRYVRYVQFYRTNKARQERALSGMVLLAFALQVQCGKALYEPRPGLPKLHHRRLHGLTDLHRSGAYETTRGPLQLGVFGDPSK